MNNAAKTDNVITLRAYSNEAGDDSWLKHWNQHKDIQEISDEASLEFTKLDDEILMQQAVYMIEHNCDVVGSISMMYDNQRCSVILGVMIGDPAMRNLGLGKNALQKAIILIRNEPTIQTVHAYVYHDNLPAKKLFEGQHFKSKGMVLFKKKSTVHYVLKLT